VLTASLSAAAVAAEKKPVIVSQRAAAFGETPALRSLPDMPRGPETLLVINRTNEKKVKLPQPGKGAASGSFFDPLLLQQPLRPDAMPAPTLTFGGMGVINSAPPDTVIDVGPSHVVEMVNNTRIQVFDKTGASLLGPVSIRTLFQSLPDGNPCKAGDDDGDPIVLYDPLADRWLISQFEVDAFPNHQCIAISQTGDPTGAYFAYAFRMPGPPDVPEHKLHDYPHYGVWPDGYYMSTNQFNQALTAFVGAGVFAFDRLKMLVGDPFASYVYVDVEPIDPTAGGMLPTDLDGLVPPPAGLANLFMEFRADEFGDPVDGLRVYEFVPDYADPGSSTFTTHPDVPLAAFDARQPPGRGDIEQMGGENLDSIPDRLMFRLAYRNAGSTAAAENSWVGNFTVNVSGINPTAASAFQAGIRWFELHSLSAALPTLYDQGTHHLAPGDGANGLNNWMGSIAQDNDGNLGLGFSQSGTGQRADIKIAGRSGAAAAGTLNEGEALFYAAPGSQASSTGNRWGDYSAMSVDPADDCTFWYAQEYYEVTDNFGWTTRIGKFVFPGCTAAAKGTLQGHVTYCSSGLPLAGAVVSVDGVPVGATDANGDYSIVLGAGSYTASITKLGFGSESGPAEITDGGTTTVDVCLTGQPAIVPAGATLLEEACAPGNGTIDPGETVTVRFCVRNIGGANAGNLVGDLEESGGVGDAPFPVEFGEVLAGGPDVCADVVFTADEGLVCGVDVTPDLELEDGATDLGVAAYALPSGTAIETLAENFDGVTAPALPGSWTTATSGVDLPVWVSSVASADTSPNAVFSPDPDPPGSGVGHVNEIVTPAIPVTTATATLSFRHSYVLENTFDGGVLEISIGGGPFQDILAAGGVFLQGGYTSTIDNRFFNPLANRQAWSGSSGGFITTRVELPAAAAGQSILLKWRCGVDDSVAATGWYVDTISVSDGFACCTPIPEDLAVDHLENAPSNDVWEPGETVLVEPSYFNGDSTALGSLTGAASNLTGPAGATYTILDGAAAYGTIASNSAASCVNTGDCYQVSVDDPAVRPAPHWDATMLETLSAGSPKTWTLHIGDSFSDVPDSHIFYSFIETIFHKQITGGCGGTSYCPGNPALRKQMAVFLLKARYGATYVPPPAVGLFADVPQADPFAPWIEDLYIRGITGGCAQAPLSYCPEATVLRQQMAVFLLKTLEGASYEPPDCEGVFGDVPCPSTFADWIEELADREITGGCGGGNFCPASPNTRGQMAAFLTKTFGLLLYAP
jgi:hypothetical protein